MRLGGLQWLTKPKVRLRLLLAFSLTRLCLVWLLVYPLYRTLADSPQLQGSSTDTGLFGSGAEILVELLDQQADGITHLSVALGVTGLVALTLGTVGSCVAWIAIWHSLPLSSPRLRRRVWSSLPAFFAITAMTVAPIAILLPQLEGVPQTIGAKLEAWLGEAGADLVELALALGLFGMLALLVVLADLVRGMAAPGRLRLRVAVKAAVAQYLSAPAFITMHAALRLVPIGLVHLTAAWLTLRGGWLTRASSDCLLALACGELAAFTALWLRLDWIAWICRSQQRQALKERLASP